jgi:gliding motility-associated-like protein/uncharacterized repeat protein (TIGR01451 family)
MKKNSTFYDLCFKRLLWLFFLLLFCNQNYAQTFCRPTSNTNSKAGVCIGASVDNPTSAYDNDPTFLTFTNLKTDVGVLCTVQETMTLNQTAKSGDQIAIYIGSGSSALSVGLLSTARIQAKLNGVNVGASMALNSPLLNLTLLGNASPVELIKFTLPGDANEVQFSLGGAVTALANFRIYDVRLEFAKPTVAGGLTQTVCTGNQITLTAAPVAGTSLTWYDSATSTTVLQNGNSFTTPNLTSNTTYYIGVTRVTGCESNERVPVVINVSNPIAPAINTSGTAICSSGTTQQTTLSVINPIPGTTYSWFNVANGGIALATGNSYAPTVTVGTTSFYVEASIGTCLSPTRTQVDVISVAVPSLPVILTQSVTIQSGQNATLNATTSEAGVVLNWYETATGGTPVASNSPTFTTPILLASKTYYVEAQSATGNCVSASRVPVLVTVQPASLGGCLEAGSQQTNQNGLCLLCGSTNQGFSVDGDPNTAASLSIPIGLINGYIQQTLQFNNPGRAGDIVDVELALPGGIADLALLGSVSLATYNGATYNNDRVLINNALVNLQLLSGNRFRASIVAGANFDRVEIRLSGLATVLTTLDIYQATYRYKAPTVSGTTTICSGQTTTLTSSVGVGETIKWFDAATAGNELINTAALTTPALTTATTYYVEITRNGCVNSERFPVVVNVNNPVAPTVTASAPAICSGQTVTLSIPAPVVGTTYNWYDAASAGNLVFTGTSFTTPILTATTNYYVEASIGTCLSGTRTPVNVIVNPLPAAPTVASSTVIIPTGQVVTLQVSAPVSGEIYDWYDAPTGGNLLQANATSYTPSPALTASTSFYISARSAAGCTSSTRTVINVVVTPPVVITSCLQPNAQAVTKGGILLGCLLCSSSNEPDAVDGDNSTASHLTAVVGVGDYIRQTLTFSTPGKAGDIIDVELGIPAGLLDISALSYVSLRSYNGVTPNSDQVNIGSLVSVQLLSPTRFKASFVTSGDFTAVEVQLGGIATLLTNLDIYGASYRYKDASIAGNASPICSGQGTTLIASSTVAGETFKWYDAATAGTELSASATYPTGNLTTTTTYYLEATRGTCVSSVRQPVTVTVNPLALASDVIITSPVEAACDGSVTLTPTSTLAGAQFKYYTDQTKTTAIVDGGTGAVGEIYDIDPTTSALTVTGLTAAGAPYSYFVSVVNAATCENAAGTLKVVTVTYPAISPLAVTSPLVGCGSANLKDAITTFDATGNTTYTFFDSLNNVITADAAANITVGGNYSIQAQVSGITCPSVKQPVIVTINPLPTLVVDPSQSVSPGTNATLNATSNGTLAWFDPQGNALTGPVFTTGALNTPGIYTYTVVATLGTCTRTGTLSINVTDPNTCQSLTERVYANSETSGSIVTGGVTNGSAAVDGNPQTYSTITTGLGLLGVGTTWQSLQWTTTIPKGTALTIKLGSGSSAVALGQGLSVIGTKRDGLGNPVDIGTMQSVSGTLLNLLSGDNSFEYTFVPANGTGPQDYDGIRIVSASLLSVAQNTKVFEAYYNKSVPTVTCTPGDIQDIFYGATDLGLPVGAVTSTVGVSDAFNVADNDITTFATMYSGVGALAAADLTVQFKTPSVVTDTLRIVISKPAVLLDVNLLTGFSIQRYLGNVAVGAPIQNTSTLLSLRLLPGNTMAVALVSSPSDSYDRVRIRLGGVAGVLSFLRVHTVERVANTQVIGGDPDNKVTVCPGTDVTLQIPEEACSTYVWYDAPTGGNIVASGITYTVPMTLPAGIYKYYVQPVRYGCEAFARGLVTVEVRASSPVNALADITLNGGAVTTICSPSGTVTLNTGLSGTPAITNPIYHWYSFDGTTSQPIAGETTAQLVVNGLIPGTYTYFVGVSGDNYCETAAADRKQITFTILRPSDQNDLSVSNVTICHDLPVVLTPTASLLTNPIFYWYLDANKTQPITNGAVIGGVTYTISASGVLTATGITLAMSPMSYYVGVSSDTTCENLAGTLQTSTVIITDPGTPVITKTTQDFCLINAPTFATIDVSPANAADIVWYDALTGGNVIPTTTVLTTGTYYAALKDPITSCESTVRLAIAISVTDPGTPVITKTTQDFCLVNAPTFATIDVSPAVAANIVWYDALTGGNLIPATTALTTGTYYAAIKDPTTLCESNVRLAIAISVIDPGTPVITKTTQDFCLVDAPTFATIDVSPATNIVWYDALTGGNLIPSTTALTTGTYYAAIKDPTTLCESNVRLAIAISVTDPGTPVITKTTQAFCLIDAPTFATIDVSPATNIVWYDALTGGNLIPNATALTTGTYYAAIKDPTTLCESNVRLAIAISVTDPGTPVITKTTQNFCLIDAPTFATIDVSPAVAANIVWYDALTGGNLIPATTALTTGTYYAAIKDPTTLCESNVRLAIAISVTDPGIPVITKTTQDFCLVDAPTFTTIDVSPATNIVWYDALTGGNLIPATTALTTGTYYAAIKDPTTLCESNVRLAIAISVTDPGTPVITKTTQDFCLVDAPTFATIDVSPATNIVWYDALTGGNLIPATTALTTGTYYAAIKDPTTLCESNVRLAIAISVTDPGTPVITKTTQDFCLVNAPTFATIDVSPATNIVWYDALTGGNLIPATTALTTGTYYAAIKDPTTLCESNVRLAIAISVTDPGTPVITKTTQDFCLVDAPTFATIDVSPATNIVWYDALTGGNLIPATTALTTGTYYAAIKDPTTLCESNVRLAIAISVTDPGTPVITKTTQDFCLIDAPTFATIDVSPATNIVWYDALTGGNLIPATTALTTGTYYAAIKDPTTLCESNVRLAIAINVTDPGTPVITKATQDFCLVDAPTFATIDVSPATNIVWYDALTGGNLIPATTALTTGTYYAAIKDPTTLCESNVRLAIAISVTDPGTPVITKTTQDFCLVDAPTFATIDVSPAVAANIVWYDALTGGNLIPNATVLTTGTYYAAIKDPTTLCESNVRLAIAINVTDPGTPVITNTTQAFCLIDAPTFATIDVSPAVAANIVWYDALTGGNLIPATTALTTGTYYAAIKDPTTLCESNVRLAIAISVTDPGTPVITKTTQAFCLVDAPTFATIDVSPATNIVWYDALTGGNLIPNATALTTGTYYASIKDPATLCESNVRLAINISVTDPGTPVITNTTQAFCLVNAPTFATIDVSPATNIVWYDALTGGNLIPATTALTTGTYYAAIKDPTTLCESNVRLAIVISVTDPGTPVITKTTQDFCLIDAPTFATIDVSPATNIVWYDALTGGNLIPNATALTTGTYYAAIKDPTTLCESNVRLAIAISVTDPGTPVITNTTQAFCLVNAPTFATIDVSPAVAANIVWYDALTGGNLIPNATALTTGTYYAAIKDPTTLCESNVRLAIAISVTDPGTPVITKTTHDFCLIDAPTFATIDVSPATNIVWYDALTGGNLIPATTVLTTGTYYAAIKDPTTLCESNVRLAIAISVTDPGTPVITKTTQDFCLINAPTFATIDVSPAVAANIVWYDALTGGNLIPNATALTTGTYYAAIKDPTTNCESTVRLAIAISVTDPGTPVITKTTQDFCLVDSPTFATIDVSPAVAANIVWYDALTGGNLIPNTTALTTGTYYAAIKDPTTLCESNVRLAIAISVTDPGTPVITKTSQDFCLIDAPTFATIDVSPATNIVWYDALTGGNLIPATTALTTGTYYAAIKDPTTNCESNVRLAIAISVTDPGTPVITKTSQDFCLIDAPTFATIDVSPATNIVWYDALTGGNLIPATTALTTGTYYAAIKDPTTLCESNVRLAINISVTDPGTPVITNTTQDFCLVNAPTFATIDVSPAVAANIVWYDALTGGNLIPNATALTTGTYYAAIKDPTTLCESNVRLAIAINVTDPGTPVITNTTQAFCLVDAPTFATINVSPATNIVWYDALTGGNLIPATTALTTGTYYAAIKDPTTLCESNVRLAITISVTDPGTPVITKTTQDFCLIDAPTFATIDVSPATNIVWYDALTGGNLIPNATALTTGTYYAAIKDPITLCESNVRLAIAISVTDPGTPVITNTTQAFCLVDAPTFATINVSPAANIVWYDALTGGNLIPNATALTTGTYYAAIKDPTTLCESNVRLAIAISVTDPGTPVITKTTQDFCLIDAPTFATIDVSPATNIVWYDALTGGNLIPTTTALTTGTYYAAIKDPTTTCESNVRLAIAISVTDPGTPVITKTTQDFCLIDAPTFATIDVSPATNIVWYDALTGGNLIPATTALTTGTYYAAIKDPTTTCESNVRLAIAISVTDPGTPVITKTTQDFCLVNAPTFATIDVSPAVAANIVWYDALTGGNLIPATTALTTGTYYAAIKDPTTLCESNVRLAIAISVTDPGTPVITKTTQDFCLVNAPTFATIDVSPATNIVWYDALTGGNLIPTTTALTTGTYYAAIKDPTTLCESNVRLAIAISVTDPGTPTTTDTTQDFCLVNAPTVASIQVNAPTTGSIVWYTAATGGTVIPSATALTTGNYFATILDPATNCESAVRLQVAVSVTDPGTPTTADATQDFCLVNAPTVANIQVDAPTTGSIVWYTAATGGTVISSATALTSGSYFASILNPTTGCESAVRLQVVISITNPLTPTTTAAVQVFCSGNNPTVASIQVNEANVVWYSAATGGTAIAPTTALANGDYFGAIKDPVTGCESNIRLKVTVKVGNTINPTTTNAAQTFCSVNAPTVASIQVNEPNVVWYTASTGGTVIPATTALTSGIYFGNIIDPLTACESSTRLQVTVTVTNPSPTPTTNAGIQNFCSSNSPKVSDIQVNEANVVWYSNPTGGTAIPATTALATGTYFGAVANAGCENPIRLAVIVNVNTPGVVTTPRTAQVFCLSALPTLANILVNEPNVVFYTSATGGTPLAATTLLTNTTYYAGTLSNTTNGCDSATRLGITISFENDALVQLTTTDDTPCVFQGVTYSIANGKSNYVWSVTNGTITSGGTTADGSATISWSDVGPGKVTVTYTNTCNETTSKTLDVTVATCSDITITNTVSNPTPNFGDQVTFTVTVNNVGEGSFINTLVSDLLPSGYNLVSASTTSGTYDTGTQVWTIPALASGQSVVLTVVAEVLSSGNYMNVATIEISTPLDVDASNNSASASVEPICLTVYNEFTPNNDGANDLFRIDCIESYPNNELRVYNRYGSLVYSKVHYENDWDGTANVSGVVNRGDMLPTGTYFYVITIGDGTVKKGWLSIMR